jgi:adenylate cyclase
MASPESIVVDRLVAEAETEAERAIAVVRITIALILFVWVMVLLEFYPPSAAYFFAEPLRIATGVVAFLLLSGVASLVLASTGRFRPWMAFAFTAGDVASLSLASFLVLRSIELGGNWIFAMPAVWAVPLLFAVTALRYQPAVQIWATCLFVAALAAVASVRGFDALGPSVSSAEPQVKQLFSMMPTGVRAVLLVLTGFIVALGMRRARALLMRAAEEASRRAHLSRFLPAEIAPLLDLDRLGSWREGRRQRVAILFVDIRDSTALAEGMDPRRLLVFISAFRRRVLRAASLHGGVVDKFIGDGALILFGLPEPQPQDPGRALACGRELLRLIDRWNRKRRFAPPIRVGAGVHLGEVYCGLVGDDARLEFTVIGDPVNVAARIEQATKLFDRPLLASEAVVAAAGERAAWEVVSAEPLRGRAGPVTLLAPRREDAPRSALMAADLPAWKPAPDPA